MSDTAAKVAGTTGAVGTIIATGATIGGSAASMTGTLAAIGGAVGGGMAAGVIVVAAAPIAVGAALYGITSWLSNK